VLVQSIREAARHSEQLAAERAAMALSRQAFTSVAKAAPAPRKARRA